MNQHLRVRIEASARLVTFLTTVALLTGLAPLRAEDWPRFLGPRGNGISTETDWRSNWKEKDAPVAWTTNVGIGFSSVSVSQGRLFTMGHRSGLDSVYCLTADGGKEIWKHQYECKLVDNLHDGGPASTPTVHGDHVYTLSKEGHLFCLKVSNGDVVWEAFLPRLLGVSMPEWGFSGSPLIVGDRLILDGGPLFAVDRRDGQLLWKTEKSYKCGYGTAIHFEKDGKSLVTALNNDGLLLAELESGKVLDLHAWPTLYQTNSTTPLLLPDDQIFISTAYNKGCALLQVKGRKLVSLYQNRNMRNHMNNSIPQGDLLFGFDGKAHRGKRVPLVCLDRKTGEVRWKQLGLGCGALIRAGDRLILFSDRGELVVARGTEKKFEELARKQVLEGRSWTHPVLSHGRIYCRNARGDLACVDVR